MRDPGLSRTTSSDMAQRAVLLNLPPIKLNSVQFSDVSYTVKVGVSKEKKKVLKNVSGEFNSGELTAIMGPSGAGKSSLLHILTGFIKDGVEGSIRCNGTAMQRDNATVFRKEACYIMQENFLQPHFSVYELMMLSANLKLGQSLSYKSKLLLVEDILDIMGLGKCLDTRCAKLSGGQAKRLSIALELVDNPPAMFLDEPTTGLDSVSSLQCAKVLKALARGHRTIVCTIHQPCASILDLFDHVYILSAGQCVYQGASFNMMPYLRQFGLECPKYHNPADFMMEVVCGEHGMFDKQLIEAAKCDLWNKPRGLQSTPVDGTGSSNQKTMVLIHPPSEWERFCILFKCFYIQFYRDWTISHLKIVMHCCVGVLLGLLFSNSGVDATKVVSNLAFLYVIITYLTYTTMMPAVLRFSFEREIVTKECFNNWYQLRTYFIALVLSSVPVQGLFSVLPTSLSYFLSSQPLETYRFIQMLLMSFLCVLSAEGFGLFIGTFCRPIMGTFNGALYTACMIVFGGFLILFSHIPSYLHWISYLDMFKYCFDGMITALYGADRGKLHCPEEEIYCHLSDSNTILKEMSISGQEFWFDVTMLTVIILLVRVFTYISLKVKLRSL